MSKDKVLFDDDLEKINQACLSYPMGSKQMGQVAELSGILYGMGVDVEKLLESEIYSLKMSAARDRNRRGISGKF